jgi:hypothetical protein
MYQLLQLERAPDWVGARVTARSVVTGDCSERETSWERKRARMEVFMMGCLLFAYGVRVLMETRDGHVLERVPFSIPR